jgi:hypothetical protein
MRPHAGRMRPGNHDRRDRGARAPCRRRRPSILGLRARGAAAVARVSPRCRPRACHRAAPAPQPRGRRPAGGARRAATPGAPPAAHDPVPRATRLACAAAAAPDRDQTNPTTQPLYCCIKHHPAWAPLLPAQGAHAPQLLFPTLPVSFPLFPAAAQFPTLPVSFPLFPAAAQACAPFLPRTPVPLARRRPASAAARARPPGRGRVGARRGARANEHGTARAEAAGAGAGAAAAARPRGAGARPNLSRPPCRENAAPTDCHVARYTTPTL